MKLPAELAEAITAMRPTDGVVSADDAWCLSDGKNHLIYSTKADSFDITFPKGNFQAKWLEAKTGEVTSTGKINGGRLHRSARDLVLWLIAE